MPQDTLADHPELLDSHPKTSLDLQHVHEGFIFGLVVDGNAFTPARATKNNFDPRVAENGVPVCFFDCRFGRGLCLVKAGKRFLRHLPNFRPLLLLVFFVVCERGQAN